MPALVAGIHGGATIISGQNGCSAPLAFGWFAPPIMDARDKRGHEGLEVPWHGPRL